MKLQRLVWGAAILACAAAFLAVQDWVRLHRGGAGLVGRTLIGPVDLAVAGIVLIETPAGQVTLERTPWGWVVHEQDRFAADLEQMRALLQRLSRATIATRVPVRPERLGELGLLQKVENGWRFERGRTASVLSVIHSLERQHRTIYQVLIGNPHSAGRGTYVRFPSTNTAYLVAEPLALDGRAERWIDRRVFPAGAVESLRQVHVRTPGRPPVRLSRAGPGSPWRLAGLEAPAPAAPVDELLTALTGLRIEAVSTRGAARQAADNATAVEAGFFDGRVVTLMLHPPDGGADRPPRGQLAARLGPEPGARDDRALRSAVARFNHRFATRVVTLERGQVAPLLRGRAAYRPRP